ncbi:MAG TPA: NUDIX domain-containing protein [Caulobacterales bacterium]|nr:NUDIX domain-containing protein [Caulobacterales bacterium]
MSLRRRLEPAITPLFRTWWRMKRSMTLGVRALATDEAGRVLLVRHTYTPGWYLPGGGVESRETALEAAKRELMEEGGVEATQTPRLIGFYANHAKFPNDHIALYRVHAWRPCETRSAGEIAERGFFARDALPDGVTAGTLRRLAEVFDGADISAEW